MGLLPDSLADSSCVRADVAVELTLTYLAARGPEERSQPLPAERHTGQHPIVLALLAASSFAGPGGPDLGKDKCSTLIEFSFSMSLQSRRKAISTENDYERSFESKFVKTSEAVNMDVAAFKFLQAG